MRAQELYNQYCKKQIDVHQFLYNIRRDMMLREFISPVNSAEDVITILKQKGQITEQIAEDQLLREKEISVLPPDVEDEDPTDQELDEYADEDEKERYDNIAKDYGTPEIIRILNNYDNLGFDTVGEAINVILLEKDWATSYDFSSEGNGGTDQQNRDNVAKLEAWRNSIIRKKGISEAKKLKLTADDVNYYEFTKGWKLELLTTDDLDKAKEKAIKNLAKDPAFYTNKLAKETQDKMKSDKTTVKKEILKAPTDQTEMKDKANQMKNVKKDNTDKKNVKDNLGKQEKAKGSPKGVKTMKLKESIKRVLRPILKEDAYNQHVEALRGMVKMNPKELAKQILDKKLPMSGLRSEFAGKVLGKAVADGNKDVDVIKAFHQLNDKNVNESTDDWKKSVIDGLKVAIKSDDKVAEKVYTHYKKDFEAAHVAGKDPSTAVKEFLKNVKKLKEQNLEEGWKSWIAGGLLTLSTIAGIGKLYQIDKTNKAAVEKADKIFSEPLDKMSTEELIALEDDVEKKIGKSIKTWSSSSSDTNAPNDEIVKKLMKKDIGHSIGLRPELFGIDTAGKIVFIGDKVKEEFSGNTSPEKVDFQDTELDEKKKTVSKVHPVEGAMHKILGLAPEETVASKYKSGPDLYNALARKIKDHKKLTGMLAYAANINSQKDVFDAALHHSKKVNGTKKD